MTRKAVFVVVALMATFLSGACTRYVYVPVPASAPEGSSASTH